MSHLVERAAALLPEKLALLQRRLVPVLEVLSPEEVRELLDEGSPA